MGYVSFREGNPIHKGTPFSPQPTNHSHPNSWAQPLLWSFWILPFDDWCYPAEDLFSARPENVCAKKPAGLKKIANLRFLFEKWMQIWCTDLMRSSTCSLRRLKVFWKSNSKVQLIISREIEISSVLMCYGSFVFGKITENHSSDSRIASDIVRLP